MFYHFSIIFQTRLHNHIFEDITEELVDYYIISAIGILIYALELELELELFIN
jgi:hypothetical protein